MERVASYILAGLTVVLTVATVMMAMTIPAMWTMSADVGAIKARLDGVDKRLETLDRRLAARDTDPAVMVAASGLRPDTEFAGLRVGAKLFVLPKTDKAQADLARAGLQREAITPSAFGYVIGTFDPAGVYSPIGATGQR